MGKTSTKGASETDYGQNNDKFFLCTILYAINVVLLD